MKKTILILTAFLAGVNVSEAQNEASMPKAQFSKVIFKSADQMWDIVKKLDEIHKYSSAIASVDWKGNMGEGGERVCHAPDGQGAFTEKITSFDETSRSYTYSLIDGAPVKGMNNTMKVVDLGYGKCILVWWSQYDSFIKNPQMTEEQFKNFMLTSIEEMIEKMEAAI